MHVRIIFIILNIVVIYFVHEIIQLIHRKKPVNNIQSVNFLPYDPGESYPTRFKYLVNFHLEKRYY